MKKFLSLVLALIMTMSLVTISAGATEYKDLTDKDEIQYEEAVAVLNRIGVITGYEDGSFRPETELTRGAAAKIIVSLMIGPDAASALPNNASPYPDVPAGHTFAGVIGYCKTAGYISGYGDGTFKPANPLTGYAFAKMLLGAIGYKSNIEGFVDTGWTMNVARIGNVAGLFDRLNFDGAKAVTRDEACQLALNTLKATMVDYGNANTVVSSSGEVLTVQGSKAVYRTSNNRDINANINRRVINATNNEMTLEFGEEHFKDLRLEHDRYDPAYDVYGHPSNEWSYKKVTIGTFKLPADFTFTKQMAHLEDTTATKEKALGLRNYDTYSTDHRGGYVNWSSPSTGLETYSSPFADATQIHINGWNARVLNSAYKQTAVPTGEKAGEGNWYTYDARDIGKDNKDLAPSLSEICDLTDNGVTVEVYVCPVDADFITDVVVTRTQLMEVDRVATDFVELDTISPDSKDPRKESNLKEIAGYNDYALAEEVISVKDNNYDAYNVLKELKSGDTVAIIPYTTDDGKTWEVGEAYVPETVSGALTNVDIYNTKSKPDGNAIAITVGGTTYPIAQWNKDMREITGVKIRATKKDVTLYLDKLGNALLAKDVGNSDAWIVVGDYYQATLSTGRVGWFVHGWTIKGDEVDLELGTIRGAAEKYAPGELVKYDVASGGNGEYELYKPNYNQLAVLKNGNKASWVEPVGAKDDGKQTGEGIYTVSQFARQNLTSGGVGDAEYNIKSVNTLLPLDGYNTADKDKENAVSSTGRRFNYANANDKTSVGTAADNCGVLVKNGTGYYETTKPTQYNTWNYRTAPYDGVKFIYVGFDSVTGEVEVINVVDGVQNVDYKELTQINRWWKNVGTNTNANGGDYVASPAEAYVDKNGKVKAVVIKSDSAEANLKDLMIITDNKGANTSTKGGAEAPTSGTYYTRQYVSGADGFKEEKTGYFDKALLVGDVVTGTLKDDGVIRAKYFHNASYTNRNPDGIYVKGIAPLLTQEGSKVGNAFYVGTANAGTAAQTLVLGTGVYGNTSYPLSEKNCDILTGKDVLGLNDGTDKKGLIKVDSTTQFIDLRDGRPGNIDEIGDLFDYKNDPNIELKILVNGNSSSDGFRHAYVIMILEAGEGTGGSTTPGSVMYYTVNKWMGSASAPTPVVLSVSKDAFKNDQLAPQVAGWTPNIASYNLSKSYEFKENTAADAGKIVIDIHYTANTVTSVPGPDHGVKEPEAGKTMEQTIDASAPGVYTITQNLTTPAVQVNPNTALSDCRVFKYQAPVAGKYRLVINNAATCVEDAASIPAGKGKFVIQVTEYLSTVWANASGVTGQLASDGNPTGHVHTPLAVGPHNYYIYLVTGSGASEVTQLVQSGEFSVAAPTPVNGKVEAPATPAAPSINVSSTIEDKLTGGDGEATGGDPLNEEEAEAIKDAILSEPAGVYTPKDYHIGKKGDGSEISSPLNMGNGTVNPDGCRLFTWKSDKSGVVTLSIDNGAAYLESSRDALTGSGMFNVQVIAQETGTGTNKLYNSSTTGSIGGSKTAGLSNGEHTYKITQKVGDNTILLVEGTFEISAQSVPAYDCSANADGWAYVAPPAGGGSGSGSGGAGGGTSSGRSDGGASSGTPATPSADEPVSDEGTPVESAPVDEEPNAEDVGEETPAPAPAPEVEEPTGDVDSVA